MNKEKVLSDLFFHSFLSVAVVVVTGRNSGRGTELKEKERGKKQKEYKYNTRSIDSLQGYLQIFTSCVRGG